MDLHGQCRVAVGMAGALHYGWDMTAALALGAARGIDARLLAELLPPIEAAAMNAMNEGEGNG